MPAQGAYDDVVERDITLGQGAISVRYLIGQIRPGRCDIYSCPNGGSWTHENPSSSQPSKGVVQVGTDAALRGGFIGVGFKVALLKDGGDYHAECIVLQNGQPIPNGEVVFDNKRQGQRRLALGDFQGGSMRGLPIVFGRVAWAGLCALPGIAHAQDTPTTTASTDAADIKMSQALRSLTEPESPTFQLLGVAANSVTRPESPKKAALGVLNSLDQDGNFQSGLAMEFSPYLLVAGDRLTLDDYQKDGWRRQLSYVQVALGTAKGASDSDKSLKASIGILWTPINGMDPYVNQGLTQCLKEAINTPILPPQMAGPGRPPVPAPARPAAEKSSLDPEVAAELASLKARIAQLEGQPKTAAVSTEGLSKSPPPLPNRDDADGKALEIRKANACFEQHPLLPDNTTSLQFGFAPLFISETGKTNDLKGRGFAASALLTIGLSRIDPLVPKAEQYRSQLVLSATYRRRETIADPDVKDAFLIRDRWTAGGRFVYGKPTSVFYSLEAVYQDSDYRDGRTDGYMTFVGGLDVRMDEGLWLGISAGSSAGKSIGGDSTFIGTRFRWGFGQKSSIGEGFKPVGEKE